MQSPLALAQNKRISLSFNGLCPVNGFSSCVIYVLLDISFQNRPVSAQLKTFWEKILCLQNFPNSSKIIGSIFISTGSLAMLYNTMNASPLKIIKPAKASNTLLPWYVPASFFQKISMHSFCLFADSLPIASTLFSCYPDQKHANIPELCLIIYFTPLAKLSD